MAKKTRFDGTIVNRFTDKDGYVHAFDTNERPCWDCVNRERVVLTTDLRRYAAGLHIGQLGWTVPGTTDAYKWVDVEFDNGVTLPILVYGLVRVAAERELEISERLIQENRQTRFDKDPQVAELCQREWIRQQFRNRVMDDGMTTVGAGADELYAFSFPSLMELAQLKREANYPVKIGFTTNQDAGAFARIASQMGEPAAFPEPVRLLMLVRTINGSALEKDVHNHLRESGRRIETAFGQEWYRTNAEELIAICSRIVDNVPAKSLKPLMGAGPTYDGALECGHDPESGAVFIRLVERQSDENDLGAN